MVAPDARAPDARAIEAGWQIVGVDGCRAGWVVARADRTGSALRFAIVPTFAALLASLGAGPAVVAVDIPIGLPPGGLDGRSAPRRADLEARAFLGPRRAASVFAAPCRPTLAAGSYRDACRLEAAARGRGVGLPRQAYNLLPKIREVDAAVAPRHQRPLGPDGGVRVHEVHPEVVFALLAGGGAPGHGLAHAKRGCATCPRGACPGPAARLALLAAQAPPFDPGAVRRDLVAGLRGEVRGRPTGPPVGRDDIVDAVACLVAARRIVEGRARIFPPDGPDLDDRGLRMEIVA